MHQDEKHPIVAGVAALAVVAVVIGAVAGIAMLVGTQAAGLGGAASSAKSADAHASLYAPAPSPTKGPIGPEISLLPSIAATASGRIGGSTESHEPSRTAAPTHAEPTPVKKAQPKQDARITLQSDSPDARPMQMVGLSGIYPDGEGAILRLERNDGSGWKEFGIPDVTVTGEQFATKIQTGRTGMHKFRMRDIDSGKTSNVVTITIH